jgi:hypothetical protein
VIVIEERHGARWMRMFSNVAAVASVVLLTSAVAAQTATAPRKTGTPQERTRLIVLAGEWNVDFESRGGPDESFTQLRTTSSITQLLGGAFIQERLSMPTPGGRPIELIGIWGFDRFRGVYRFAWLDDTYALFDVHEGTWDEGALVVTNLRARTTLVMSDQEIFGRMIWSQMTPDGFSVESQASTDGGKTWFTQARGRYSRRK